MGEFIVVSNIFNPKLVCWHVCWHVCSNQCNLMYRKLWPPANEA